VTVQFLIKMKVDFPNDLSADDRLELRNQEAIKASALAKEGVLLRLWRADSNTTTWGIWQAEKASTIEEILVSLPLHRYMNIEIHQLAEHPNDPVQK
jgi:muconolactone D-isomerase